MIAHYRHKFIGSPTAFVRNNRTAPTIGMTVFALILFLLPAHAGNGVRPIVHLGDSFKSALLDIPGQLGPAASPVIADFLYSRTPTTCANVSLLHQQLSGINWATANTNTEIPFLLRRTAQDAAKIVPHSDEALELATRLAALEQVLSRQPPPIPERLGPIGLAAREALLLLHVRQGNMLKARVSDMSKRLAQ